MRTRSTCGRSADDNAAPLRPTRRWLLTAAMTALLAACGGGGGDSGSSSPAAVSGPPSTGATLTSSASEAGQAVESVVAGADAAVARRASLSGLSGVVGAPVAVYRMPAAGRKHALAVLPSPCTDWVDAPCAGSATVDTNLVSPANTANPGDYIDARFTAVSGTLLGDSLLLNGRMRIDFLSTIDLNATTLAGLSARLTLESFSGAINGKTFGPVTDLGLLQIDSLGQATLTSGGARYRGLGGVTATGPGDYTVAGAAVRKAYWADAARYVDLALTNWPVTGGRPVNGALADVTGAQGAVSVAVVSTTQNTVVYAVVIATGSGTANYVVTATYPNGGGAPYYRADPA